jgi:arsenite methyltransferase
LTYELVQKMGIAKDSKILDVACGLGTTAIFLAKSFDCRVNGIDLASQNIENAKRFPAIKGISKKTEFRVGDAECRVVHFIRQHY